ncbi:MFS transporter [Kitasatospora sp. LaBMicrA B282]|uniref:MFS transporter n=1 Tax=Kitasatospora sp. LaBMicrA B282 TaxID=3420949 RepID=UPI003D0EE8BF
MAADSSAAPAVPAAPVAGKLPRAFHRLWAAGAASSLGDGVYLAALPLLAARLTQDPVMLGLVSSAALLPWFFFGLIGGALVDRWDRRRTMWLTDLGRAALLVIPCVAVAGHLLSVPLLIAVALLLGTGQVFFDSAASAYLPQLLDRDVTLLQRAGARQQGATTLCADFAGPPLGGLLFSLGRALPFGLDALSFLASSLLIRSIPQGSQGAGSGSGAGAGVGVAAAVAAPARRSIWAEAKVGAGYLLRHRLLLGLALRPAIGNVAFVGADAVLVLYAHHTLHLGDRGYGLLLVCQATGGLLGTVLAGRLGALLGTGGALTATALLEGAALIGFGLCGGPIPAGLALAGLGAAMGATMVLAPAIGQALIPLDLAGRVGAARRLLTLGAAPLGALLGGWLASSAGLQAPFLVGGVMLAATSLVTLTVATNRRIEEALAAAKAEREAAEEG